MAGKFGRHSIFVGTLVTALPRLASAQASEPGLTTVDPRAAGVTLSSEVPASAPSGGSTHVFDAYRVYVDYMASQRYAGAVSSLAIGAAFLGTGAIVHSELDEGFGIAIMVGGAVVAVPGALTLLFPTEAESVADQHGVYTVTRPSPEQESLLEAEWARLASKARTARAVGAGITFVFAAAALGVGIYAAASDRVEENTKNWLIPSALLSGGATAAGAMTLLMVETPTESAYAAFIATRGTPGHSGASRSRTLRFSAAPIERGAWASVAMDF